MKQEKREIAPEVLELELKNFEKQLQFLEAEYIQYKERIDQIADPQYATELKERILAAALKIKKLEKRQKKMETNQKKRDKMIIKKKELEPELSQKVVSLTSEVSDLEQKLKEVDARIEKHANTLHEQATKIATAKENLKKLSDEAGTWSIPTFPTKEEAKSNNIYEEQFAKKAGLEKALNLIRTRYTITCNEYTQKKLQLQNRISSIAESIQKKNGHVLFF